METILEHAQGLVYALLGLMPSRYQKTSLSALLGMFLEAPGHALPQHCTTRSASALSRFLNIYGWSTRSVLRTTRQTVLKQMAQHLPRSDSPLKVIIDLTTLPKCGEFRHLGDPTEDEAKPNPWVRVLKGKRGLHLVVLYLVLGQWRVPWSFCIWHGKGTSSPAQLACKLLARVPQPLTRCRTVLVLADTEFGITRVSSSRPKTALASGSRTALQPSLGEWQNPQTTVSHWQARTASAASRHECLIDHFLVLAQTQRGQTRITLCRVHLPLFWRLPSAVGTATMGD